MLLIDLKLGDLKHESLKAQDYISKTASNIYKSNTLCLRTICWKSQMIQILWTEFFLVLNSKKNTSYPKSN